MIIIGLTGHPSSGKDTVAEYIANKGFAHISCGDLLREEMKKEIYQLTVRQFVFLSPRKEENEVPFIRLILLVSK